MAMPSASNNDESTIAERPYDEYALRYTSQLHPHRKLADGLRNIPVAPIDNVKHCLLRVIPRGFQTATTYDLVLYGYRARLSPLARLVRVVSILSKNRSMTP